MYLCSQERDLWSAHPVRRTQCLRVACVWPVSGHSIMTRWRSCVGAATLTVTAAQVLESSAVQAVCYRCISKSSITSACPVVRVTNLTRTMNAASVISRPVYFSTCINLELEHLESNHCFPLPEPGVSNFSEIILQTFIINAMLMAWCVLHHIIWYAVYKNFVC